MGASEPQFCLVLRPSKAEFSKPFCEYIQDVCKKNPDIPMFKVVPPKGWSPRKTRFPTLESLRIQTPIKQHVFGTGGAFRCLFVEQRGLSVADFKKLSGSRAHKTPPKGHRQDELLERAFWSSVTINPPFYGADTPTSFFDEALEYGWNLRDLKDLLKQYDVPPIAGVTTPMVYFGMWKSFFSWHVEDVDLYSINYLHFGAPKVWYCVSPKDRPKFEEMAKSLFPELHNVCPAFLRHKDILLSPKTLRNHHISYVQAKQEAGEFIVLNAGAYHSGFNLGFNCAEAVNFALPEWLPTGRAASHCTCTALPDHVHLDMKMFSRGPRVSQRLKARRELEESDSDSELDSDSESSSGSEVEEEPPAPKRKRGTAAEAKGKPKPKTPAEPTKTAPSQSIPRQKAQTNGKAQPKPSPPKESPAAKQPSPPKRAPKAAVAVETELPRKNPFASANRSPTLAKLAAARGVGSKRLAGQPAEEVAVVEPKRRRKSAAAEPVAAKPPAPPLADSRPAAEPAPVKAEADGQSAKELSPHPVRRAMDEALVWMRTLVTGQQADKEAEEGPTLTVAGAEPLDEKPCAIVGEDEATQRKYFFLVQRLRQQSKRKGSVVVRWLKEEADGIFRPSGEVWEEAESALVPVRTQPWQETVMGPAGFRLLTLRYRILDTELVD